MSLPSQLLSPTDERNPTTSSTVSAPGLVNLKDDRTPPPPPVAPSAAFALRAQIIDEDEPGSSYGSGYRRARAGTMPSSLPADSPGVRTSALSPAYPIGISGDTTSPPLPGNGGLGSGAGVGSPFGGSNGGSLNMGVGSLSGGLGGLGAPISNSLTSPTSGRPNLRHANSSAPNLEHAATSRNRSGSLTSDMGLGAAFTSASGYGSSWLSSSQNQSPSHPHSLSHTPTSQLRSPLGHGSAQIAGLGHGHSLSSSSHSHSHPQSPDEGMMTGDLSFSTLDYLGLADGDSLPPASVSGQRELHRRAIETHGAASRLRASTVSNVRRPVTSSTPYSDETPDEILAKAIEQFSMYDSMPPLSYGGLSLLNRPRATTIGALDNPMQRNRGNLARSRDNSRGPRLSVSSTTSRTGTPDGMSTPQMPTRSLWIGNLDVNTTSESLLHVFAPYGAIESLRLLPEKTCAFVNFMEKGDAVRARDDVLNRLGGHLPELSETAAVRVGFGKIDSAPTGPPTSTIAPAPPGLVFTNGVSVPPAPVVPATPEQHDQSALPTRALWIGSIPSTTSSATLLQIFSPFGPVESARVLTHKSCGFVNFERLDSAVSARNALNARDILGSDVGPIRIGFARVPTKSPVIGGPEDDGSPSKLEGLGSVKGATAVSTEQQLSAEGGGVENYRSQLVLDLVKAGVHDQVIEKGLAKNGAVSEQQMIMQVLSSGRQEEDIDVRAAADLRPPASYYTTIPGVPDRRDARRAEAPRLRDIRKRLDTCTVDEVDSLCRELLDEVAELSSDYIGNTIVQKLFERATQPVRVNMLERIAPTLAMIGVHKNGTWAAQKIIECATTDEERELIALNLRAFAPPLMCDSLGNYVCAGTLRFESPNSDYVYDAMIDRMWDIAQNRFGARCMRTCLESSHTSLYQKKRIATGIILNSIPLATNPNGALLLTWLVEQSALPGRYGLLANRFVPHVAHLATHKLASLTVLRIINQTSEPQASTTLLNAIFHSPSDQILTEILSDASNGSQVIGKILAISTLSAEERPGMIEAVRRVLPAVKGTSTPPYRRLMEEVGLPVPPAPTPGPIVASLGPAPPAAVQHLRQQAGAGAWPGLGVAGQGSTQPFALPNTGLPMGGMGMGGMGSLGSMGLAAAQGHPHLGMSMGLPVGVGYGQPMYLNQPGLGAGVGVGGNLSPLMIPNNMAIGSMRTGSPNMAGSPRTPQPRQRGRMSPVSQMMSPGSDPFNPFASPSIDIPYMQQQGLRLGPAINQQQPQQNQGQQPPTFEAQPNVGGLGIVPASAAAAAAGGQGEFYGQSRMFANGYP